MMQFSFFAVIGAFAGIYGGAFIAGPPLFPGQPWYGIGLCILAFGLPILGYAVTTTEGPDDQEIERRCNNR